MASSRDYSSLQTPELCVADFCLVPIGTPTASVSKEIAEVQRLLATCGLEYTLHSAGTTVEGPWDEVFKIIGQAHALIHKNGIPRVQTDIRVGTRIDKKQTFSQKVEAVNKLLAADKQ
ncbi:cell wall biogenesis protein-like protein Ecm15 [Xylona heveae TC161]|uniref:Cell wall biogenesis protein-like protein Ecm15 n=1 Tax=Xylona heveae (strain CBS 132557 / TC161) TaxID=1328760 RepID=A0A165G4U4_XYLHT|nr:cell wall biogenesis protein-like protein Ecm15 [Xylona heveae TC161]KZF21740.1 cell wall biogenesis protein-like protein Ecm15 [Xylona heveae TC161]